MITIGVDPGYERCGYAVIEKQGNTVSLLKFGVIKTSTQKDFSNRLLEIAEDFQHLLDNNKPNLVSIEDLFFVTNITTGIKVAQVRGTLMYLAKKSGCLIAEPKPVEIKSTFTGNGRADKIEMRKMAQLIFSLEELPKQDDAVDAIGAAFWGTQKFGIH